MSRILLENQPPDSTCILVTVNRPLQTVVLLALLTLPPFAKALRNQYKLRCLVGIQPDSEDELGCPDRKKKRTKIWDDSMHLFIDVQQ